MNQENYLDYERILNHVKKENVRPIYLFFGSENYLKENILNKFKNKLINSNQRELNYKVFYGNKNSISEIINELQTIPFISKYKLVVIKEAEKITQKDEVKLINYFNHFKLNNNFSVLLIIYKENTPDKEIVKAVKRIGLIVNFNIPNKTKLIQWIKAKFRQNNKEITPEALFYLQSLVSFELSYLFNEIEKIDIYTRDKKIIEKEDIITAIGGTESVNIFKVLDSLGQKRANSAIDGLVRLDNGNLHSLSILAMIYRQIRLILRTKLLLLSGANFNQIKKELKLPSFIVEKIEKQSKKYTIKELCRAYKLLNIADLELKDSQKNSQIILEELVMNIINQAYNKNESGKPDSYNNKL